MTLWPVADAIARETMVAYYTELRTGVGRGDALRRSKLALLARPGRNHPYYWAAFIQSGEWTTIESGV
jgi:CHAT domain-containing protein